MAFFYSSNSPFAFLQQIRDVIDRLARYHKHLVSLVIELTKKGIALNGLNEPIDTTSSQGRLIPNIFASLAEIECDLIRERTKVILHAARARLGERPEGLSTDAKRKDVAVETIYRESELSVREIVRHLDISK